MSDGWEETRRRLIGAGLLAGGLAGGGLGGVLLSADAPGGKPESEHPGERPEGAGPGGERPSLRAFGAKLDGTTDDSPALARAVEHARAHHVPVYHPGGPCRLGGAAAELDTSGVAFIGIGLGDFDYPYGHAGSQFWIDDTARSPFVLGSGCSFDGLVFYWPQQVDNAAAPIAYKPLFVAAPNAAAADVSIRNCQVTNAYDFLEATAAGSVLGNVIVANCRIYAIRNVFTLRMVPEVLIIENNLFSLGVFQNEVNHWAGGGKQAGARTYLSDFTAGEGSWCLVTGDGTPERFSSSGVTGIMASNNFIYGYRHGIRVRGGNLGIARLTSTHFDAVSTVLEVEPGGTMVAVQLLGSLLFPFDRRDPRHPHCAFVIRDPSPDENGNPICQLSITACDVGFAAGPLFDISGTNVYEVRIAGCKLTRFANTEQAGHYPALRIDAPNAKLSFGGNDVLAASEHGTGLLLQAVRWASITGNTFEACRTPVELAAGAKRVLLSGNLSAETRGTVSVSAPAALQAQRLTDSGNSWDKPRG